MKLQKNHKWPYIDLISAEITHVKNFVNTRNEILNKNIFYRLKWALKDLDPIWAQIFHFYFSWTQEMKSKARA